MANLRIELYANEEILSICRHLRKHLSERQSISPFNDYFKIKAGKQARKTGMPITEYDEYLDHLLDCKKCQQWVKEVCPEALWKRSERISKYCCAGFYCRAEEYSQRSYERVRFTLRRGEDPVWLFGDKGESIVFCPWCGSKLPYKPID